jgi:16S rRNA G966 N2-methylase RsmD
LKISALILTDWLADRKELTLEDLAEAFTTSFRDWLKTKKTRVSYDLVVEVARDSIREIAGYLRQSLSQKPILDSAMAVVGRFDIYKNLLEDFSGVSEEEARLYIADITAYILINQLLFYHIISEKLGYDKLPDVDPLNPPKDFMDVLEHTLKKGREAYPHILGFNLFPVLRGDLRIVYSIARVVSTLKALRPQHIREDLFGRLYHETIPPETRKNLGAFYTKPEAAKLLASLAIDRWDAKVLDPACGSGTLLVEAYQRKAALAPPMSKEELHKRLIDDIWGIDVMHFAYHMTSMNLTAQNIEVPLKPHVLSQDGIKTMIESAQKTCRSSDPPQSDCSSLFQWIEFVRKGEEIPKDFDVVIMNPPFTRRERIPVKKEELEKLVPEVKGKTGYWAYFIIAADKLLKENGTLAIVIPEEFFVGRGAQCVRDYIFNRYCPVYVIRSCVEIAFSESALYRDYLIVLKKAKAGAPLTVVILNKKLIDVQKDIEDIARQIKDFTASLSLKISKEEFDAIKFLETDIALRHRQNLKPLVGFNAIEAQIIALELLNEIKDNPTLEELRKAGKVKLRLYRPGQFKVKGVERYSEKLFCSRYGARSPNVTFIVDKADKDKVRLKLKQSPSTFFDVPHTAAVPSLRSYSGVKRFDITNEEEFAIIDPNVIPRHVINLTGMLPLSEVSKASKDIKEAYNSIGGNALIARRVQLTSPGAYWLAFFSSNKILGSQLPSIQFKNYNEGKLLTLYWNSVITLIQLLSFVAESRGSWVSLDHNRVWLNIHVPNIDSLKNKLVQRALILFDKIGKADVKPLFWRIKEHNSIQREIDELALEMLGLEHWRSRLDEIYNAVAKELETMHKILETSRKQPKKAKVSLEKTESSEKKLDVWIK